MRFVFVAAVKDIRRRMADPAALLFWIGLPLLLGGLLSFISSTGGDAPPRARLLLVDQDNTPISGLLPAAARRATRQSTSRRWRSMKDGAVSTPETPRRCSSFPPDFRTRS